MMHPQCAKWGSTVLRVVLGIFFLWASIMKLVDIPGFVTALPTWVPTPLFPLPAGLITVYAYALPWAELVAGVLLILGLWTQWAGALAALIALSFLVGRGLTEPGLGSFPNKDWLFLASGLSLFFTGSHCCSIDEMSCGCSMKS